MLNLILLCENLKRKNELKNKDDITLVEVSKDYSYESLETFNKIESILNLAYFKGTYKLEALNDKISLTLDRNYFRYVVDDLKEIIDIFSIDYLEDELVLLEGTIK